MVIFLVISCISLWGICWWIEVGVNCCACLWRTSLLELGWGLFSVLLVSLFLAGEFPWVISLFRLLFMSRLCFCSYKMMRYTFQEIQCLLILRSDRGCMLECPRHGTEPGTLCSRISLGCPESFTGKELLSQSTADTQSLHLGLIRPHSLPPSETPGVFLFTCVGVP